MLRTLIVFLGITAIFLTLRDSSAFATNLGFVSLVHASYSAHAGGEIYLASEQQAKGWFDLAVQMAPSNGNAYEGLGILAQLQGKSTNAARCFEESIAQGSANHLTHFRLGNTYDALGRRDDAIREWRQAGAAPYFIQKAVDPRTGPDDALKFYRLALAIGIPPDPDLHSKLGNWLWSEQQWEDSLQEFRMALQILDSTCSRKSGCGDVTAGLHVSIGYALWRGHQDEAGAIAEYQRAIKLAPNYMLPWLWWGDLRRDQGRFDEATELYQHARRLWPESEIPLIGLGQIAAAQQDGPQAENFFKQALGINPNNTAAHDALANVYLNVYPATPEQRRAAIEHYKRAGNLYGLAGAYGANGQIALALETYRRFIAANPRNEWGHYQLARLYISQGQIEQGIAELQEASRLVPANHDYLLALGDAYRDIGKVQEAIATYRQALRLMPGDHYLQEELARLEKIILEEKSR